MWKNLNHIRTSSKQRWIGCPEWLSIGSSWLAIRRTTRRRQPEQSCAHSVCYPADGRKRNYVRRAVLRFPVIPPISSPATTNHRLDNGSELSSRFRFVQQ